jgi:hypothetical protein
VRELGLRLAFRERGDRWVAYIAAGDSMDGAQELGSIAIGAVTRDPALKQGFMDLMKRVLEAGIAEVGGGVVIDHWEAPVKAEEAER